MLRWSGEANLTECVVLTTIRYTHFHWLIYKLKRSWQEVARTYLKRGCVRSFHDRQKQKESEMKGLILIRLWWYMTNVINKNNFTKCLLRHFAILAPYRYNPLCYEPPWIKNIFIHINMQYNSISSFSPPLLDCFLGPVVHISGGYKVQIPGVVPRMPCSKSLSPPCGTTQGLLCWCWRQYGCCTSCLLYSESSFTPC